VRTGLLKPRRRAMLLERDYDRGGDYDESLLTVFNEIIKERLDWI
jgi:hypothetical protein